MAASSSMLSGILVLSLCLAAAAAAAADRVNKSIPGGGVFWATGKDEGDLLALSESQEDASADVAGDSDEFAGGFSSLEGMLQWAIGHSDPVKLKEKASDVRRLSVEELKERQLEIKDLMDKLKMPSDAELMKIAISDLNDSTLSLEDRQRALNELLILVEPIDNANDLDKLGGLVAVARELHSSEPEIRKMAAWILGKASQNNALVQNQILALGTLAELMKMAKSSFLEEAIKAFYAISSLIRNNDIGQELFFLGHGVSLLRDIMGDSDVNIRLKKKAIFLVADLTEYQSATANTARARLLSDRHFLKSVVGLASLPDLDLQEKVLLAIRSLLHLPSMDAYIFKDFCDLIVILEAVKDHLEELMTDEELSDYARDVEGLRGEVRSVFHERLVKEAQVPT